ncbi:MAG TPA: 3-deoxy-7-phosphoheptulonate synthase [Pseudonocardiaceae bacterium]|nr:3-deoxy-7-phosphoheptulonate synthase [Pseudonocardiaceae bacterium]
MTTTLVRVDNQRIAKVVPLVTPDLLHHDMPLTERHADTVLRGRAAAQRILHGEDDRLLVIVGPCSIHDVDAAREYAARLRPVADELADDLVLVMRCYFEKPRTVGGWKGLINDPGLDGTGDVNRGLRMARQLLLDVVDAGLPVACEWLDTTTPAYIADTVSWGAIGARTVESQVHRQLAAGLSMPVGMKNRPDGSVPTAIDAIRAAACPHVFTGVSGAGTPAVLHTTGNPDCHVVLRGGRGTPNYDETSVRTTLDLLTAAKLPPRLVIDASHDNSAKDHTRQPAVARAIGDQIAAGQDGIVGVMLESHLVAGRQDCVPGQPLVYGQSITDACMAWDTTRHLLDELADAVTKRRAR